MHSLAFENPSKTVSTIDREAYPFRDHWVSLSAGNMHYVDEGEGETLLFIHGTPTWSFEWRHLISALSLDYRCIAPDLMGFGLSGRPREFAYTPEAHAEAIQEFVDKLNLKNITLVVHDFGGPIALPVCLRNPILVKRLVIINSWMWSFTGDQDMERKGRLAGSWLFRLLYQWTNFSLRVMTPQAFGDKSKLTPEVHQQYLDRFPDRWSRGTVLWTLARALMRSTAYFESLWAERKKLQGRPTLIVWGMKDPAFPPYQLHRWRRLLPDAEVVRLKDAGHWPHEEAPRPVIHALRRFLL